MPSIKIAAVSYLNTVPMIYGIERSEELGPRALLLSPPSGCAEAFRSGQADVALIPVGALHSIEGARIVTPYCIGAERPVRTVKVMSDMPIERIGRIWLDGHSLTSAALCRILAAEFWGIDPQWEQMDDYSVIERAEPGDAFLLIGDKVFGYEDRFRYQYDLAECWRRMTGLPFVFAVWVARDNVTDEFIAKLERAIGNGIRNIPEAIEHYGHGGKPYAREYLTQNINFNLDEPKRRAMYLFLRGMDEMSGA